MNNNLRLHYLKEIGIQNWQNKSDPDIEIGDIFQGAPLKASSKKNLDSLQPGDDETNFTQASESIATKAKNNFVAEPGETRINPAELSMPVAKPVAKPIVTKQNPKFENEIQSCQMCVSRTNRLNALVGQGNPDADIFIICEPPNAQEDNIGHYLVGQTLTLFDAMLSAIDQSDNYFFTGILKCHSLQEYLVSEEDIKNCSAHLNKQVEQIKPRILVILGAAQAQKILQTKQSFNKLRGKRHTVKINDTNYPAVITYHPAFLLRNSIYKREALCDLLLIKSLLK